MHATAPPGRQSWAPGAFFRLGRSMFRWFENLIAAFPEDPPERPPETLLAFYAYFISPVWPAFAALLVAGLVGSLIEVALMTFVGQIVDLMKAAPTPAHSPSTA
jgi:ATP-binding cassette subfamily B multidrug efflux pump